MSAPTLGKDALYIVTAAHVVSGDEKPKVSLRNPKYISRLLWKHSEGRDEVTGLALLVVRGSASRRIVFSTLSGRLCRDATRFACTDTKSLFGHVTIE